VSFARATPLAVLAGLAASMALLLACAPCAHAVEAGAGAPQQPLGASPLDAYIAGVARAWEPYTAPDGRVNDPLNAADTGDNYGVIMLADVMLKVAHRTGDSALEAAGTRIVASALTLPVPNDPFNLLAIAAAIHDGEQGDFPASAWAQVAGPLEQRAGQIGPPTEASCLIELPCYDNWRLVWSAGAALLLADRVPGAPGSLAGDGVPATAQIDADLALAVEHAGPPLQLAIARESGPGSGRAEMPGTGAGKRPGKGGRRVPAGVLTKSAAGGTARELSDPGAEPPAYELFSTFMLELVGELDPSAITPAVARLRRQADRYALDMMAPDGQLSLSGRSLDQSWVQAAAAALGARRALLDPGSASAWRSYAERAVSYLLSAYPLRADGLLPIVPGLSLEWNPSIMDGYAALNQYEGLTLWLLSDALAQWPRPEAAREPLPGDSREMVADDLGSSGLVWGRSGSVWWQLSGRTTSNDPRSAQGLVAVKLERAGVWRDLLALRPRRRGPSSVWTLETARRTPTPGKTATLVKTATPTFTRARGEGGRVVLTGVYRQANGHLLGHVTWTLATTATGARLSMSMPAKSALHTTVWLPDGDTRLSAPGASFAHGQCVVTASGPACPVGISWHEQRAAVLEVGA
jgi:hypothetical protein